MTPVPGTQPPPAAPAHRTPMLWQRLWRRPFFKRTVYEIVGMMILTRRSMQMLNCGHADATAPHFDLPPDAEPERLAFQLYHRVGTAVSLQDRDVLETGCGAGAGARFLAATQRPRTYVATDSARLLIRAARRRAAASPVRFRVARADRLPFPEATFDVALSLESTHTLADKAAYLREIARVLRPAGRLVVADFYYVRENASGSEHRFRAALEETGFTIEREADWTRQAVAALEADSPRRVSEIGRLPRPLRRLALAFAGTTASPLYRQLREGQARYLHFVAVPAQSNNSRG